MWLLLWRSRGLSLPIAKELLYLLYYMIPVELAGNGKQYIVGFIAHLPEIAQILALQLPHTLCRSQRESGQGCVTIEAGTSQIKDTAHRLVIASANFLQNNVPHLFQVFAWESRRQQNLLQQGQDGIKLGVDHLGHDPRCFPARTSTLAYSQLLKCLVQGPCILRLRSLKEHILKQVCQPCLILRLMHNGCL